MGVVVTLAVSLILAVATVLLAKSHNRPFDAVFIKRSEGRWWGQIP